MEQRLWVQVELGAIASSNGELVPVTSLYKEVDPSTKNEVGDVYTPLWLKEADAGAANLVQQAGRREALPS